MCVKCGSSLAPPPAAKSKLVGGLLGIFLGTFGVHRFYLGYTGIGVAQVLLSTVGGLLTCGITTLAVQIWGLIEGIMILAGSIDRDALGVPLKD
jgi:TM2 domain-containing membrane protein YozV